MDFHLTMVVEPGRAASLLESEFMEQMQKTMNAQMAQMARQSSLISMATGFAMQKMAQKMAEKANPLGKWKCQEVEEQPSADSRSADSAPESIANVEALGEASIDGTAVRAYRSARPDHDLRRSPVASPHGDTTP